MIDVIHDAERMSLNTVSLSALLEDTGIRFHSAVIGALIREGFDLDETMPCLQHPLEILESIQWLGTLEPGAAWDDLHNTLLTAGKIGILVDLSARRPKTTHHVTSIQGGWAAGNPRILRGSA